MALSCRKEGDECVVCKGGALEIVFASKVVGKTTSGIRGIPIYKNVVEYLACPSCGVIYHTDRRGEVLDKDDPSGLDRRC